MIHVELVGHLFQIDLHAPKALAMTLLGSMWVRSFLSNEEVLFNPETRPMLEPRAEFQARPRLGNAA